MLFQKTWQQQQKFQYVKENQPSQQKSFIIMALVATAPDRTALYRKKRHAERHYGMAGGIWY